ncbi:MAG: VTT domain-containing protein [Myxococcota bacterium]
MRLLLFPIILFALGGTLAWAFADQLAMPEDYAELVTWLRAQGDYAWAVGLLLILGDALLPVPSAPAMFAMGVIYGPLLGTLISGTAMVLASLIGYGSLKLLGRGAAVRIIGEADLERTERFYERWGMIAVIFGRAIGGPAEWAVIFAGLSNMPFRKVLGAISIGAYVASAVVASLGAMSVFEPALALAISLTALAAIVLLSRWMTSKSD